jgi:iron-sulfur cluster assembly accessory protein
MRIFDIQFSKRKGTSGVTPAYDAWRKSPAAFFTTNPTLFGFSHFSGNSMITLTSNAASHLLQLLAEKAAADGAGLRIQVDRGGCAGWQYTMKIDQPAIGDKVFTDRGVSLIVDTESLGFLENSQIDYVEALNDSGFRVLNPNAERSCGCGTSFEPKQS